MFAVIKCAINFQHLQYLTISSNVYILQLINVKICISIAVSLKPIIRDVLS